MSRYPVIPISMVGPRHQQRPNTLATSPKESTLNAGSFQDWLRYLTFQGGPNSREQSAPPRGFAYADGPAPAGYRWDNEAAPAGYRWEEEAPPAGYRWENVPGSTKV